MCCRTVRLTRALWRPGRSYAAMTTPCATLNRSQTLNSSVPTWAVESGIPHPGHKWVFLLLSYLDKSVKIRSDDQPPVPHIVSSPSSAIPYVPLVIRSMLSDIHFVMTSLVFHAFASHSLSPGSHTSPAHTRRLWLCVQCRRVCDVQQILEAVWWCYALWGWFRLFGVRSNWLVTSDDRSTVPLIGSFYHQLLSESSLLR